MSNSYTIVSLYYDPYENTITHENGQFVRDRDLQNLISYTELQSLKKIGGVKYLESDEDGVMYKLVAPIPEDEMISFFYDKAQNVMFDEDGYVIFNIFAYIRPQDLRLFKMKKTNMHVFGVDGQIVELIYPEEDKFYGY